MINLGIFGPDALVGMISPYLENIAPELLENKEFVVRKLLNF